LDSAPFTALFVRVLATFRLSHPGRIDVLVSDVEFQPEIQVLFMSGYAEGLPDMKLPPGALFLQEAFRFLRSA